LDARGQLFPLAFGVVDAENDANWLWFLEKLRKVLEQHIQPDILGTQYTLTILSDRQKGLIEGVETIFPLAAHGFCLKHLEANMCKKFKHLELIKLL
jgi:transposase-like protein